MFRSVGEGPGENSAQFILNDPFTAKNEKLDGKGDWTLELFARALGWFVEIALNTYGNSKKLKNFAKKRIFLRNVWIFIIAH